MTKTIVVIVSNLKKVSFHNFSVRQRRSSLIVSNLKKVSFHNVRKICQSFFIIVSNLKKVSFHNTCSRISKHLSSIDDEGELEAEATLSKMEIVQQEGTRLVKCVQAFYNLDAIISVSELLFSPIDFGRVCFYVILLFCPQFIFKFSKPQLPRNSRQLH